MSQILHKRQCIPTKAICYCTKILYLFVSQFIFPVHNPKKYSVYSSEEINSGLLASTPGISFPLTLEKARQLWSWCIGDSQLEINRTPVVLVWYSKIHPLEGLSFLLQNRLGGGFVFSVRVRGSPVAKKAIY